MPHLEGPIAHLWQLSRQTGHKWIGTMLHLDCTADGTPAQC